MNDEIKNKKNKSTQVVYMPQITSIST